MHNILIIGPSKSGKTTKSKEYTDGFNTLFVNYNDFKNHTEFMDNINNFLDSRVISSFFDKRPKLLLFDDIDILLAQNRSANKFVTDLVKSKRCNTVITCVSSQEKRIMELKKVSTEVVILKPVQTDQYYFDQNIYDNVTEYFTHPDRDISDIEYLLTSDVVVISYIIYDNYYKYLDKFYNVKDHSITPHVSEAYMQCCRMEDIGFNSNDWMMIELANIVKCFKLRLLQRQQNIKKKKPDDLKINYTQITSRAAQECTVLKKLQNLNYVSYDTIEILATNHYLKTNKKSMGHGDTLSSVCSTYLLNVLDRK